MAVLSSTLCTALINAAVVAAFAPASGELGPSGAGGKRPGNAAEAVVASGPEAGGVAVVQATQGDGRRWKMRRHVLTAAPKSREKTCAKATQPLVTM